MVISSVSPELKSKWFKLAVAVSYVPRSFESRNWEDKGRRGISGKGVPAQFGRFGTAIELDVVVDIDVAWLHVPWILSLFPVGSFVSLFQFHIDLRFVPLQGANNEDGSL